MVAQQAIARLHSARRWHVPSSCLLTLAGKVTKRPDVSYSPPSSLPATLLLGFPDGLSRTIKNTSVSPDKSFWRTGRAPTRMWGRPIPPLHLIFAHRPPSAQRELLLSFCHRTGPLSPARELAGGVELLVPVALHWRRELRCRSGQVGGATFYSKENSETKAHEIHVLPLIRLTLLRPS